MSKTYDHDEVWLARRRNRSPVWGPHSRRVYAGLLQLLAPLQPPPARLFDAGCGAGAFGVQANAAGYVYCGVDDSREGVELGKEAFPGVELHCVDVAKEDVRAEWRGSFDIVTAVNALHCLVHDDDRARFLKYLRDLLKPSGVMALTTMCAPVEEGYRPSPRPRVYKEPHEILAEIRQAGFSTEIPTIFEPPEGRAKIANLTVLART